MKAATLAMEDSDCVSKLSSTQPPSAAQNCVQDWRGEATCQKIRMDADAVRVAVDEVVLVDDAAGPGRARESTTKGHEVLATTAPMHPLPQLAPVAVAVVDAAPQRP
jgi:hypothetical protein